MISQYLQPPLVPGMGNLGLPSSGSIAQTKNPFFSIGNQFLPRNLHDLIRWVRFITVHSPVTTEVMRKLATYPITNFIYESKDPSVKQKYEELTKSFRLKTTLHDVGFQYFTLGNVFISIYYPFIRTFTCPSCKAMYNSSTSNFLTFKNWNMSGVCPKCGNSGVFIRNDVKSKNVKDMNLILWDPLHISVNHNPISGKSRYYYTIPNDIKRKILMGDKLILDSTPWEFIEAVKENKDFEFSDDHIFHMRNVDTGMAINGISVPPMVSHFNLVFYQTTLRRANESIATDFMAPMRVIFPQAPTANSDPVMNISLRNFTSKIEEAIVKHKHDNNHVLIAPVPIGYQAISGEGKALLVNQEIAQAEESLLLSMGVSRELLSGTTNWTSSTVGLRMLKNTLDSYVGQVEELLDWIGTKTSSFLGIPNSKIGLTPFQLTDDESLKVVLSNLISTGNVSMSTIYESLGKNYQEELEKIAEDAKAKARHDVRVQFEIEQAQYLEAMEINKLSEKDDSYMETLKECQSIAQQMSSLDPMSIRLILDNLRVTDYAKYLMVSKLLDEAAQNAMQTVQTGPDGMPVAEGQEGSVKNSDSGPGGSGGPEGVKGPEKAGQDPEAMVGSDEIPANIKEPLSSPQGNEFSSKTDPKKKTETKK